MSGAKDKKFNIFVAYHKPSFLIKNEYIIPVNAGREVLNQHKSEKPYEYEWLTSNMQGDDTGENISFKNPDYCELTVLYWIWKNSETDYTGLMHYRRFFSLDNSETYPFGFTKENVEQMVMKTDVILPKPLKLVESSIYEQFALSHDIMFLDLALDYIKSNYKEMSVFADMIKTDRLAHFWNMIISKKSVFDDYMSWLFEILNYLENYINQNNIDYPPRLYGFISERLFNIYFKYLISKQKVSCKFANVIYLSNS